MGYLSPSWSRFSCMMVIFYIFYQRPLGNWGSSSHGREASMTLVNEWMNEWITNFLLNTQCVCARLRIQKCLTQERLTGITCPRDRCLSAGGPIRLNLERVARAVRAKGQEAPILAKKLWAYFIKTTPGIHSVLYCFQILSKTRLTVLTGH